VIVRCASRTAPRTRQQRRLHGLPVIRLSSGDIVSGIVAARRQKFFKQINALSSRSAALSPRGDESNRWDLPLNSYLADLQGKKQMGTTIA
jgi:hypothetical protein